MHDSPFWQFSLALYRQPGVPDACLQLQDESGADVNVMFYVLFLARNGRRIGAEDLHRIETLAGAWREDIVKPLRQVRRRLKSPPSGFRDDLTEQLRSEVKRIELEAERLQQLALERLPAAAEIGVPDADLGCCAAHNLGIYTNRLGAVAAAPVDLLLRRLNDS